MKTKSILSIKYESEIPAAKQALTANDITYKPISNNKFEIDSDAISSVKNIMKRYEINFEII